MESRYPLGLDLTGLDSPSFVVDAALLEKNAAVMKEVGEASGAQILLALKGFSMYSSFPLLKPYLQGTCASGINEARLGKEEMGLQVHSYSPAYSEKTLRAMLEISDHLIFNSPGQWERFAGLRREFADRVSFGLRFNPSHSETETAIYDPSAPKSRLGTIADELPEGFLTEQGVEGLHVHNLCEKDSPSLLRTWEAVERVFSGSRRGELEGLKWINLGGGHHITRPGYQKDILIDLVRRIRKDYKVEVYLEPGEAWALNAGYLVATVLDIHKNRGNLAILDTSASCHMPDVLEMPYRPHILGSGEEGEKAHTYRLGGVTCLAGDVIGDYSFDEPLEVGDRLVFTDMAIYSMVKTTTFNGVNLPSIYLSDSRTGEHKLIRRFGYEDFRSRL